MPWSTMRVECIGIPKIVLRGRENKGKRKKASTEIAIKCIGEWEREGKWQRREWVQRSKWSGWKSGRNNSGPTVLVVYQRSAWSVCFYLNYKRRGERQLRELRAKFARLCRGYWSKAESRAVWLSENGYIALKYPCPLWYNLRDYYVLSIAHCAIWKINEKKTEPSRKLSVMQTEACDSIIRVGVDYADIFLIKIRASIKAQKGRGNNSEINYRYYYNYWHNSHIVL